MDFEKSNKLLAEVWKLPGTRYKVLFNLVANYQLSDYPRHYHNFFNTVAVALTKMGLAEMFEHGFASLSKLSDSHYPVLFEHVSRELYGDKEFNEAVEKALEKMKVKEESKMYVYKETEHNANGSLYTVGFYDPNGKWEPDGDYDDRKLAAARVAYLNGLAEKAPDEMGITHVKHYQINGKYRIKIERTASTKGVLGYTIEANGDDHEDVMADIIKMKGDVECLAPIPAPQTEVKASASSV